MTELLLESATANNNIGIRMTNIEQTSKQTPDKLGQILVTWHLNQVVNGGIIKSEFVIAVSNARN